jgi:ribosomal protein L11 methyltransferase
MNNYIQITVSCDSPDQQEILVALLSANDFEGFEENEMDLLAFIPEIKFDEILLTEICSTLSLPYSKAIVPFTNWNKEWEKNFEPVTIREFCGIRAAFHQPIPQVKHEIIITPKMSFGTGHHATTWLMINAMEKLDFKSRSVLDFGAGTGILGILAEKMGAVHVLAIDNDPLCINNAEENIAANECQKVILALADQIPVTSQGFDIILANVNRNVILEQLPFFKQQLTSAGVLIVGGLLNQDLDILELETENNNLSIGLKYLRDNWLCLEMHNKL